jgi:hypothetical protein
LADGTQTRVFLQILWFMWARSETVGATSCHFFTNAPRILNFFEAYEFSLICRPLRSAIGPLRERVESRWKERMIAMSLQRSLFRLTKPARYLLDNVLFKLFARSDPLWSLKDSQAGKPVLVIGNGPSLNQTPLEEFVGVPAVGMNKIDLIFGDTNWRPEVIVCLNSMVARQHQSNFAELDIPVFLAWKSRLLLSRENRRKMNFFNVISGNDFSGNPVEGFGSSATVTYTALQLAHWMGADPVILFGVDHSFKFRGSSSTYQIKQGPDENHFHPGYFGHGAVWATPDLDQSEIEYQKARAAFEADGRTIYDATIGGKLEVFEKIDLVKVREILSRTYG